MDTDGSRRVAGIARLVHPLPCRRVPPCGALADPCSLSRFTADQVVGLPDGTQAVWADVENGGWLSMLPHQAVTLALAEGQRMLDTAQRTLDVEAQEADRVGQAAPDVAHPLDPWRGPANELRERCSFQTALCEAA